MLMEQEMEVQSKKPEKTEVEEMKKQLEISYGQQMNMMTQMVISFPLTLGNTTDS